MFNSSYETSSNTTQENPNPIHKKKTSLLKKKKLPTSTIYSNIDLKPVVNIADVCFINEEALRMPDTSQETLLKSLYRYNMISKVTLNNSFINIELKKNCQNVFPPEYFIERLRSFGDRQMANVADNLQKINRQFSLLKQSTDVGKKVFTRENEEQLLKNFLSSRQDRKFFVYFNQISPQKMKLRNIIFSVPLLQALGCNIKNIGLEFLKYKHIFFQVFTAKNYGNFIEGCFERYRKIQDEMMVNPQMSFEERRALTEMVFYDEVIRKKEGPQGIYQQISLAKVIWYLPHPSICYFQILDINEAEGISNTRKYQKSLFEETKPSQQLELLKKIDIDFSILQIEGVLQNQRPQGSLKLIKTGLSKNESETKPNSTENILHEEIQTRNDFQHIEKLQIISENNPETKRLIVQ